MPQSLTLSNTWVWYVQKQDQDLTVNNNLTLLHLRQVTCRAEALSFTGVAYLHATPQLHRSFQTVMGFLFCFEISHALRGG